ncbi:Uncharacterised protein [Candidatus Bilamarchaeum dharawalense]|uniref:Elongation factor 1-alpha n=1 Tax=Candidatus Bilamarchaeum dharawalense TaxID=2885759 RepID=A0A5E4LNI3_9ARCH|nr:Uncharacterised protein [Candidatus Bilamarchaeum dharawalense]
MFVAVLSDKPELRENFCKNFGSEISRDDICIYSANDGSKKIWLIDPVNYPEKIQPLLYTLSMADFVVLMVDGLTPKVGELMVALNSLRLDRGVIVTSANLPVGGTVLEKYEKVADQKTATDRVRAASVNAGENAIGLVYKTANQPSLGHVAYGALKGGKVKKQDKLFLLPDRKDVEIRSIHVNGSDVEELSATSNFEIAYKGDLVERGILAPLRHEYQVENIVNGRFTKSPFFKDELKGKIHAYTNMQYVEGHLTDNDLTLSAPLAFEKGELILVVDASNQKLRIAGVFQSKW